MTHAVVEKVAGALKRLGGVAGGIVVAVSGGPDSVALLRALLALDASPLILAHLNHQLRGPESDADEAFVQTLRANLVSDGVTQLQLCCERLDVAAAARAAGANLEDTARRLRYDWLTHAAQGAGARWVATGHTADDQAETVLHRLLRGTGWRGLRGIAERRPLAAGIDLIRPLLHTSRAEVLDYLRSLPQEYRIDESNLNRAYVRNRIRHELLPYLAREFNPAIASVLGRLAEQADELYQHIEEEARQWLRDAELPRAGTMLVFDRLKLTVVPRDLLREMFRLVWRREKWPQGEITFEHWDRLASLALGETQAVDLPGGIRGRGRERVVQIQHNP